MYDPQEGRHIPVIDLEGIDKDVIKCKGIVKRLVNHGILVSVLEEIKEGVCRFYEQNIEMKKEFYTCDPMRPVFYNSNFDL
ncbi:1-aminocyclopropane-1-carboxylate oxidase like protein 5 [Quercus suber]|uniref:1-aminocyclopropane-1-carboxylate oxidase like protein 5 n=1 Tax=Quercus suber TaxID=58331 RepID=A0AAW0IIS4_QUESU